MAAHVDVEPVPELAGQIGDGRLFDDVGIGAEVNLEGRVVEVTHGTALEPSGHSLEDPAVEADEVTTGSKWQPVEIDRRRSVAGRDHRTTRRGA